jgi:hypothetical protein
MRYAIKSNTDVREVKIVAVFEYASDRDFCLNALAEEYDDYKFVPHDLDLEIKVKP